MSDGIRIQVTEEQFNRLEEILDAPAKRNQKLSELLNSKTVFDVQEELELKTRALQIVANNFGFIEPQFGQEGRFEYIKDIVNNALKEENDDV